MKHESTSTSSATNELTQRFLAIPPGRRGPMMQLIASFRSHESLDDPTDALHAVGQACLRRFWTFVGQVRFLRRQFLQEGELPFTDVLSEETIKHALNAVDVTWLDRLSFSASQ